MTEMGIATGGNVTKPGRYWLLDTETVNMLDYYQTEAAALRDVAEVVREHGPQSPVAQHLLPLPRRCRLSGKRTA